MADQRRPGGGSTFGPGNEGGKGKKGGKGKNKQLLLLGGGGAAAVVVFALVKRQSASSTGTATTGTIPTNDSTSTDQFNQLSDQLAGLQQQLSNITQGAGSTTTPAPTPSPAPGPVPSPVPVAKPPSPLPPRSTKPSSPGFSWVKVSHGQTLSGIASSHHETLATLLKDNPVYTTNAKYKGGNMIWAGDNVKVR